jgi:DNA ligase-1
MVTRRMVMIKRPMLATKITNIKTLKYPFYVSRKLDGIRALTINGVLVSRKFKPIPNNFIRERAKGLPDGLDGELILDNGRTAGAGFNETSGAVMRESGEPNVVYHIFDYVKDSVTKPADERIEDLIHWYESMDHPANEWYKIVTQASCPDEAWLTAYEMVCLKEGFEGVMVRAIKSPYKEGRSTEIEGYLLKLKRFEDAEAKVSGFEEKMHNTNPKERDAFGDAKRSTAQAGKVAAGTLGKLYAIGIKDFHGMTLEIGSGFNDIMRQEIWDNQPKYLGKIVKYRYQKVGVVDKPRFPVFLGFRDNRDM